MKRKTIDITGFPKISKEVLYENVVYEDMECRITVEKVPSRPLNPRKAKRLTKRQQKEIAKQMAAFISQAQGKTIVQIAESKE